MLQQYKRIKTFPMPPASQIMVARYTLKSQSQSQSKQSNDDLPQTIVVKAYTTDADTNNDQQRDDFEAFTRENEALRVLSQECRHVIRWYWFDHQSDNENNPVSARISMENMDMNLENYLSQLDNAATILPLYELVKRIIKPIFYGLNDIHSCGYAHFDIKYANIFVNVKNNKNKNQYWYPQVTSLKIGDFGAAHKMKSYKKTLKVRAKKVNQFTIKYVGMYNIYLLYYIYFVPRHANFTVKCENGSLLQFAIPV